jgi:ribosomal-protein-alanine N-acetyltransferase
VSGYSEILRGETLTLRRITAEATPDRYLSFLQDPEVVQYLQARFADHSLQSIRDFIVGFYHINNFLFGVYAPDNAFIGTITLRVNPVHRFSNLGYMIGDKAYWKGNISMEMCQLILDFAFFERGVRKILECTTENHIASNFNFKRLGFTLVAKIPDLYWGDGRYQAATYWSLDAAEWAAKRGRDVPVIPPPARP